MTGFAHVLKPGRIGTLELPNRVIMAPMGTEMGTPEGLFTAQEIAYYTERARGGTGLVMTGISAVSEDYETLNAGLCCVHTDAALPGLTALAESIHAVRGLVSLQLTAGLGRNINVIDPDRLPISASDNPHYADPSVLCRPLEIDEIHLLVRRFGEAAARAAAAGMDAIDIHGHTGYLIDQFMSVCWNRRTDVYGGSVENRCRFATEIIAAVKANAPGLPVSFRLSVNHRFAGGRTTAEGQAIAVVLAAAGLDLIIADDGSYEAMDYVFPPYYLGEACMVPAARALKDVVSIPVMAVGNLTPENAEAALAAGDADFAGIGRGLIADPEWAGKLTAGDRADIRPCIRCNSMCVGNAFFALPLGCAVNPQVGFERERRVEKADVLKHVVVIGGGPGGLESARVAALRGHSVDLYEAGPQLGGVLLPAATPEFKKELRAMIGWWERQFTHLPVTVHLDTTIDADSLATFEADEIIVATGSLPLLPSIPGLDGANVIDVLDFHRGVPVGHSVVIAGGGLSGCDAALELAGQGCNVTIVELADELARDMIVINRITLLRELGEKGVRILTGHTVTSVDADGLTATGPDGAVHVTASTVIAAFGVRPNTALTLALEGRANVHPLGDCVHPAKVGEAINAAFLTALVL
ncbi:MULTISPECIES: FAD-dependent oxidoreductase [unclassified Cryobacterium]|uniref:oxidoreductase n=1 Tax=unclassified Cryobacterium TaxID=2649013 RepID=UPI00106A3A1C|nr:MULTISPECIES: FAD-dependent oxidoreductase [unclassified Cryobacterium]TFB98498.1 NADH:flavin oxidoreductase [Cryobacterium sp. MDB2-A-1]TFC08381.1 NADH:flavin oxidoreductase [Cryobacterium sp. MDB2-33-2]TFC08647.1 NADH:flavin oxidoreductase [Cryobacterium sp. MDB2-A-2]TFC22297.1 NADH:flavin oxidoreductase [Cryobacterium sp. MDB2-10]